MPVEDPTQGISAEHASSDNVKESIEEIWYLKEISFKPDADGPPGRYKIITQNFNGLATPGLLSLSYISFFFLYQTLLLHCNL